MNFLKRAWESKSNVCQRPGVTCLRERIQTGVESRLIFFGMVWRLGCRVQERLEKFLLQKSENHRVYWRAMSGQSKLRRARFLLV